MRILIVTTYFEPDQGAASIILTRLAKKLQARGHQITVLTTLPNYPHGRILDGYRGKFQVVEDRDGVHVIQTWLWATPNPRISRKFISQISFAITALLRGLFIPRPDVMLIVAQPIFTNLAGTLLSRLKRTPYVLDVHDLWPDHMLSIGALTEKHPVYRLFRWLVDNTYKGAKGIIALTPHLEKVIRGYIPPTDKVQTVFSGVDLDRFRPGLDSTAFREKYDLGDARLVAYIGTLGTAYDCETMLETAKQFVDTPDVCFAIIGTGTQKEIVRARLAKGDLPNVRWIEWVDYADIPQAWASTYIAYWALHNHPLHRGAIGTKMYEAMASGIPVTVALEGVVADVLRESGGGFSVPFEDVNALSAAIRRLLDDPDLYQRTSQAARAYAEQHFDAQQTALKYEAALQKAAHQ
jgi:colanic acid biosynthesis glycosyl transferase WcaI